jgi:hypothetical protein
LPNRASLFFHARGDPLLGVANADRLFAASANQSSRLEVIAGHDHLDTYTHNPAAYMSVLLAFIGQQLAHTAATCPNIETGRLNPRPGQLSGRGEPWMIARLVLARASVRNCGAAPPKHYGPERLGLSQPLRSSKPPLGS